MKVMIYKYLLCIFLGLLISNANATERENIPPIGKETEVFMGDRMVEQRTGKFSYCIVPKFNAQKDGPNNYVYLIKKDIPLCEEEIGTRKFKSPYKNAVDGSYGNQSYDVVLREENGTKKMCFPTWIGDAYCKENLTKKDYYFTKKLVEIEKDSFQRVIEYAGKKGSIVKFIYSEFQDDMARNAFTREFEVDLDDGNTVAYKGCVFEVIKVNNSTIKYKVIRHFKN